MRMGTDMALLLNNELRLQCATPLKPKIVLPLGQ